MKRDLAQRVATIEAEGKLLDKPKENEDNEAIKLVVKLIFLGVIVYVLVQLMPLIPAK